MSIDIDGNDYWIWDALTVVEPRVVIIETHIEFGMNSIVVPYDKDYMYPGKHPDYFSASPVAVDMDPILELVEKYNLKIIEDAAEVHGAESLTGRATANPQWKRCGGLGHISVFSFYANKLITTGEGGMVLTNDPAYAEKARSLRNLCFLPHRRFYHTELGHNFRLTNLQAAIGLGQLERMEEIIARKRWMGHAYTEHLKDIPGPSSWACTNSPFSKLRPFPPLAGGTQGGGCLQAKATPSPNASPVRASICHPG